MIGTRLPVIAVIAHPRSAALIPDPFFRKADHHDAVGLLKPSALHCAGRFNNNICCRAVNDPRTCSSYGFSAACQRTSFPGPPYAIRRAPEKEEQLSFTNSRMDPHLSIRSEATKHGRSKGLLYPSRGPAWIFVPPVQRDRSTQIRVRL
jgi:hypothetical protein